MKQSATVHAFYGDAIFPAKVPRIWCVNYKSSNEKDHWFKRENIAGRLDGLVDLVNGNVAAFNNSPDEEAIAIARRAIIFNVDTKLFREDAAVSTHRAELIALADEHAARHTPFPG